jgi:hypothetical protein
MFPDLRPLGAAPAAGLDAERPARRAERVVVGEDGALAAGERRAGGMVSIIPAMR